MAINAIPNALRSTLCDVFVDAIDAGTTAGTLEIHTAAFAALLATLTFSDPAFGAASSGVATASAITSDNSADATGTAAVLRVKDGDATVVFEGTVTASAGGGDIEFDSVSFSQGTTISIAASGTITQPAG